MTFWTGETECRITFTPTTLRFVSEFGDTIFTSSEMSLFQVHTGLMEWIQLQHKTRRKIQFDFTPRTLQVQHEINGLLEMNQ